MPTTSRYVQILPSRLAEIAARIEQRRAKLGLSQQDLARRCNEARLELLGPDDLPSAPRMTRDRVAKILMARRSGRSAAAAKALYPHEIRMFAGALETSLEWLVGPDPEQAVVVWDPLTEPRRAQHFLQLIEHYRRHSKEMLSWAEFLPCSFETPEVMHAHHLALFGAPGVGASDQHVDAVVKQFDDIGARNRERTLGERGTRTWIFTHIMLLSDLANFVAGSAGYRLCSPEMRRACLRHLIEVVSDESYKMRLCIVADGDVDTTKVFHASDSLFLIGDTCAAWRDHAGNLMWTVHPDLVRAKRRLLEDLRSHARYAAKGDVVALLMRFSDTIGRQPGQRGSGETPRLSELIQAVLGSDELTAGQRAEALRLLDALALQAALPSPVRAKKTVRRMTSQLSSILLGAASLAPLWAVWQPLVGALFGLE
jgi:transcriptional regulator with XRE-family HTH domain